MKGNGPFTEREIERELRYQYRDISDLDLDRNIDKIIEKAFHYDRSTKSYTRLLNDDKLRDEVLSHRKSR